MCLERHVEGPLLWEVNRQEWASATKIRRGRMAFGATGTFNAPFLHVSAKKFRRGGLVHGGLSEIAAISSQISMPKHRAALH